MRGKGKVVVMDKKLPLELDVKLKIECWTYYKMAIIHTLPNYMNWLSSHMKIFAGIVSESAFFGDKKPHPPEYYSDILYIEEIDLYTVPPDKIVNRIKDEIDRGFYYVVFICNENDYSHEAFIYGYNDEENIFYTISLNENGHFYANVMSFEELETGYFKEYKYNEENSDRYYSRHDFGYVMSRIKPTDKYIRKNYAAEYFDKISSEVYGTRTDLNYFDKFDVSIPPTSYYTGIVCLSFTRNKILEMMNRKEENIDGEIIALKRTIFKLYEHRLLIYDSMKWYENVWQVKDRDIIILSEQYKESCVQMNSICMIFLKYTFTRANKLLETVAENLIKQYDIETSILRSYYPRIREWYMKNVLPEYFRSNKG